MNQNFVDDIVIFRTIKLDSSQCLHTKLTNVPFTPNLALKQYQSYYSNLIHI